MENRGLWQAVLGELEVAVSRASFATWFKQTGIIDSENGNIVIAVPNAITKEWLEKKYHSDITGVLNRIHGGVKKIEYRVSNLGAAATAVVTAKTPVRSTPQPVQQSLESPAATNHSLNSRYTFDNFVVGSSNELAYAAAQAVAKNPGTKYNPLFIYGGVGLGKTHLIQAIGNEILRQEPSKRIEYISSEAFTNEFLAALSKNRTQNFAEKYRNVDVLIIDDIQFLAGKERTQEEFFHTFNTLYHANKQIIISSDRPPQAITGIEDRMRTRFAAGMLADVQAPDLETRSAILINKAAAQGMMLLPETVEYLARSVQNNIRELEGALTRLIAHCEVKGLEPTVASATALMGSLAANRARTKSVTAKIILEKTAAYYDLQISDLIGAKRDKEIVVPRQICMYLMRHELEMSFPKIAASVGGRDHTTAMHSVGKIERQIETDENLRAEVNAVRERLAL